jgi:hypothetical protein
VFRMRSFVALVTTTLLGLVAGGGSALAKTAPLDEGRPRGGGSSPVAETGDGFFLGTWATVALTAAIATAVVVIVSMMVTRYQQHRHLPTHA